MDFQTHMTQTGDIQPGLSRLDINELHRKLTWACIEGEDLSRPWSEFRDAVRASAGNLPHHLRIMLDIVHEAIDGEDKQTARILDHGCGGCTTLFVLLALGYEGIHGVDIGGPLEAYNRLVNDHLKLRGKRFFIYEGVDLPFPDDCFSLVFSNQVVEHIRPDVLERYYSEEGRTLAPGGRAYHQVPHRLVPYDSHTKTWFVHLLPRSLWLAVLRRMGRDLTTAQAALFLRWPWTHRALARKYIGQTQDRTMQRFLGLSSFDDYDGPAGLRAALSKVARLPLLGKVFQAIIRNFVMIDTVSSRPGD